MHTINSNEINLTSVLRKTLDRGETILVSEEGHPIAFLVSAETTTSPRPFGLCKGEFEVPDDFNDPSPEIEAMFYGD